MTDNNNIDNQGLDEENFLFGKNKEIPFTTPPRYFDSLTDRIMNKIEVLEELSQFSMLADISKQTAFDVPANYFAEIENEIEYKAELSELSELSKAGKPVLHTLEAAYLDTLKEKITSKIALQDELKPYATLYNIDKQQNFEVSADYFENVADRIKEKIHAKSSSKVSVMEQLLSVVLKPKFGLAFGVVVIIGILSIFYFNKPNTIIESGDCKTLACLEKREMLNEHTIREMDDDNLYDMVDVDKLDKQIGADSTAVKNK